MKFTRYLFAFFCSVALICTFSGAKVSAEFVSKDGKTYFVDKNGNNVHGLKRINGYYYYFNKNTGAMVKNTTAKVGDSVYKFGKDGKSTEKINGMIEVGKVTYCCKDNKILTN